MKRSNFAFTLAEVLITLAIIGVVAAMTIPTLVNKYQDRVNETRYKKAISMLSQAVQLSMAEIDSPGNMKNTDLWNCKDKDDVQACYKNATKKLFKSIALDGDALINKMAEADYGETTNPWDNVDYAFTTGDGITFGYASADESLILILDTNVASKPNNLSKDLYALQVGADGKVVDVTASLADGGSGSCTTDTPENCTNNEDCLNLNEDRQCRKYGYAYEWYDDESTCRPSNIACMQ